MSINNIKQLAIDWMNDEIKEAEISDYYCETRDVFQSRLDKTLDLLLKDGAPEQYGYFIYAIMGEIGNNSFDHNIGNWPTVMGVFFGMDQKSKQLILADKGQGVLSSLKKVKPQLDNHQEAINTAFTERITGRAPEERGNGLKFVKENIKENKMNLEFYSGDAIAKLNNDMIIEKSDSNYQGCLTILKY